jgi:hypothetical protein
MAYIEEFNEAFRLARVEGFDAYVIHPLSDVCASSEAALLIKELVIETLDGKIEALVGECFKAHYFMKERVSKLLGTPVYMTFGYLQAEGERIHYMPTTSLLELLRVGNITDPNTPLHAWLTLPSMEIIDITTNATMAYSKAGSIKDFDVFFGSSGGNGYSYHPQIAANS